jgi:SsrA-binding protein
MLQAHSSTTAPFRQAPLDSGAPLAYLGAAMHKQHDPNSKLIAENRRARFDYFIESDLEAGIVLTGSEVKALRSGQSNIAESYASVEGGELWLINSYISSLQQAGVFGHEERRRRKLLVSRRELARLWQAVGREGMTIVPLRLYFNEKGRVKLSLGVAKGKKAADKRETEAKRDWGRQKQRLLKHG